MTKTSLEYSQIYAAASDLFGEIASDVYQTFVECDGKNPSRKDFGSSMAECAIEQALFRNEELAAIYEKLTAPEIAKLERALAKESLYYLN